MTEAEWLAANDPIGLMGFEGLSATERKLRLFGVACCRHTLAVAPVASLNGAVETAERFADGRATEEELDAAGVIADGVGDCNGNSAEYLGERGASESSLRLFRAASCAGWAVYSATCRSDLFWNEIWRLPRLAAEATQCIHSAPANSVGVCAVQCDFFRDIFGNPFRPITVDRNWLTSTVVALARQMYESRDFYPMPILADALQDAGCDNDDILNHCRGSGPHVRGCWVIDLLLGKE
jgi:hypothetical protein